MSKLLTIIPTRGLIFTKHQDALESELAALDQYPKVLRTEDIPLPEARNLLVEAALEIKDWRYLLMMDDDNIIPDGGLKAMINLLSNGKGNDIAVIDYPHHLHEYEKEMLGVGTYENWKEGQNVKGKKLAWAGLGCVLIKREALEKMDKPVFKNTTFNYLRGEDGLLRMDSGSRNAITGSAGEDVYFFFEARRLGLKVAVVPEMVAGHCRIERFVLRLTGGKYRSSHKIAVNDHIDRPEI